MKDIEKRIKFNKVMEKHNCIFCGKPITSTQEAMFIGVYKTPTSKKIGSFAIVHKGVCDRGFCKQVREGMNIVINYDDLFQLQGCYKNQDFYRHFLIKTHSKLTKFLKPFRDLWESKGWSK